MTQIISSDNARSFLKNTWYVAALTDEVKDGELFSRKILNINTVIYRKQNGQVAALRDRCPHRFAPLSIGKQEGDEIRCIYHGLRFNDNGECTDNPHGNGKIPKACAIDSFKVVERDGFIWLWPGDQARADESLIPKLSIYTEQPQTAVAHTYMFNAAPSELIVDNVMDLSHIDHLHGPFINTAGKLSEQVPKVTELDDGRVHIRWDWQADPAIMLLRDFLPRPEEQSNMFIEVTWQAPTHMILSVGAVQDSENYHQDGAVLYDFHTVTPETDESTHYFFASTRNYLVDDGEYNKAKMEGMIQAFVEEDKPVVEAQYREMGSKNFWDLDPVLLSSDAGGLRVRRLLDKMIEQEQSQQAN